MVLPMNLAMTQSEISAASTLPDRIAWMSCHFSSGSEGIIGIPEKLPAGSMLILTDGESSRGHSRDLAAQQLADAVEKLGCASVLVDFQRPPDPESAAMVYAIVEALPCPVAVTAAYSEGLSCPVFLAPCPLHVPMADYLLPWNGREIWLEAALCQENITVTKHGTTFAPVYPVHVPEGSFYSEKLRCRYSTSVSGDCIAFTLFDTPETLKGKLQEAHTLGVRRMVGLYQELGTFF